jgi:hypothetical protein
MLGHLRKTHYFEDLQCPHCQTHIEIEWTTEYGDPMPGDYNENCPECGKSISFNVEVTTTYTVNSPLTK